MSDQPVLIKVSNGKEIAIKPEMTIGRQAECDVQLTEGHASRRHARMSIAAGAVWIEDLTSANGTFINGARITARVRLSSGDRLRFDVEEYDFKIPSAGRGDDDKTLFRSADAVAVDAASSGMYRRPGAWADPDALGNDGGHKTKFIDPSQLKQMIDASPNSGGAPLAASIDGPHLQVLSGSRTGLNIRLTVGEAGGKEWTVGSQPDREVRFQDSGVSALHAKIVNEGARWKVVDQMSANGTYVNGKRCNVSYLTSGDRLLFGPVETVFQASRVATGANKSGRRRGAAPAGKRSKALVIGGTAFAVTILTLLALYVFLF